MSEHEPNCLCGDCILALIEYAAEIVKDADTPEHRMRYLTEGEKRGMSDAAQYSTHSGMVQVFACRDHFVTQDMVDPVGSPVAIALEYVLSCCDDGTHTDATRLAAIRNYCRDYLDMVEF